jgi:hypothetical protein
VLDKFANPLGPELVRDLVALIGDAEATAAGSFGGGRFSDAGRSQPVSA